MNVKHLNWILFSRSKLEHFVESDYVCNDRDITVIELIIDLAFFGCAN